MQITLIDDIASYFKANGKVANNIWESWIRTRCAEAQNWRCCYCHVQMDLDVRSNHHVTLEHVIPRSKGGRTLYENCVAACKRCNKGRGNRDFKNDYKMPKNFIRVREKSRLQTRIDTFMRTCVKKVKKHNDRGLINTIEEFNEWFKTNRIPDEYREPALQLIEEHGILLTD